MHVPRPPSDPDHYLVTLADPYEPSRCWGDEKYSLSNMLLRQVRFPLEVSRKDFLSSVWSDRVYSEFREACKRYLEGVLGPFEDGRPLLGLSEENFLGFVRVASGIQESQPVTGARFVRYTNVSSGYPVYRMDAFHATDGRAIAVYSNNRRAPNITRTTRPMLDRYGLDPWDSPYDDE